MNENDLTKKRIVVVGGGGAGSNVVRGLAKVLDPSKHELVLITSRPQFTYLPASLRVLVSRKTKIETVFMPYDALFATFPGELKIGTVSLIEDMQGGSGGRVILRGGEELSYDVLVVATGSSWQGLVSFPDEEVLYKEHIELWRDKFEKAKDVVIVGGGSVGIELSGEIKDVYPDKSVTIVQGAQHLLSDIYPLNFRLELERKVQRRGVEIILEDIIEGFPEVGSDSSIKTRNGVSIKCDLLVSTRGAGPNTSLLKLVVPDPLNERGQVRVLPTLQVQNHPSIFAAGDIIDLREAKQFQKTAGHASIIVSNIMSYLSGRQLKKECKPGKELIIISNGRNGGAAYIGQLGIQLGDSFAKLTKSRDFMVWYVRKSLGLPAYM